MGYIQTFLSSTQRYCQGRNQGRRTDLDLTLNRYCASHREDHHIDLKSKRCKAEGCGQRATHGYVPSEGAGIGGIRLALFCYEHKQATHVDVNKPMCAALCPDGGRCPRKPTFGDAADCIVR